VVSEHSAIDFSSVSSHSHHLPSIASYWHSKALWNPGSVDIYQLS